MDLLRHQAGQCHLHQWFLVALSELPELTVVCLLWQDPQTNHFDQVPSHYIWGFLEHWEINEVGTGLPTQQLFVAPSRPAQRPWRLAKWPEEASPKAQEKQKNGIAQDPKPSKTPTLALWPGSHLTEHLSPGTLLWLGGQAGSVRWRSH